MSQPTVSGDESARANKCMEICQALVRQGQIFSFSLKVNPFPFTLNIKGKENVLESRTVTEKVKKAKPINSKEEHEEETRVPAEETGATTEK